MKPLTKLNPISIFNHRWAFLLLVLGFFAGAYAQAPATPVLNSPANNATGLPVVDTLTWTASLGAATYRVQLSTDSTFTTTPLNDSTVTTTSRATGTLGGGLVYYWRVNAKNAGGTSGYSLTRHFTTIAAIPVVPTLTAPANNATGRPISDTLKWNTVAGATTYHVQLSTDTGFTTIILEDSTITGIVRSTGTLTISTPYYWRVSAKNTTGASAYSARRTFTTAPAAPATPVLTAPANNATGLPVTADTLSWAASTGAVTYRVQLSSDSTFATTALDDSTVTATIRVAPTLAGATAYYWRVNAKNPGGSSTFSAKQKFTTVAAIPAVPTLTAPANNATGRPISDTLKWNASAGAVTYRVQLSTDSTFLTTTVDDSTINGGLTGTVRPTGTLANSTVYYWRVNAKNATGTSAYSARRTFTTAPAVPAAPVLTAPANNTTGYPVLLDTLTWAASTGATNYHVQLSTDSTFATTTLDVTVTTLLRATGTLAGNTVYYWHVNASNTGGVSAYTATWKFTTVAAIPPVPTLSAPNNNATNRPVLDTLRWTAAAGAATYHVQLSTDSTFATNFIDDSTVTAVVRATGFMANGTVYYWHVNAKNATGTSAYSIRRAFTVVAVPPVTPAAPVLTAPVNNATGRPVSDTLSWAASTGAATYRVQLSADSTFATTVLNDSTVTGTTRATGTLTGNTVYYWKVNAKNTAGTSAYSTLFKFTTTAPPAAPTVPVLSSPANNATGRPVSDTLKWTASTGAATYRVQLSTDSTFATTVLNDSTITGTIRATGTLAGNTSYYWRVNAKNTGGTSAYSALRKFTTIAAAPATPVQTGPASNATSLPLTDTLKWAASAGAATYRVQLSTDVSFATTLVDDSTLTATSRVVGPLALGTVYYWRVSAQNGSGVSNYTTIRLFTTETVLSVFDKEFFLNSLRVTDSKDLRFALSLRSRVEITLFDSQGRLARKLVDEVRDPGYYNVQLPADLKGAYYLVDFKTSQFHKTMKLAF